MSDSRPIESAARLGLSETVTITETGSGALVVDRRTLVASEVNSTGLLILGYCRRGVTFAAAAKEFTAAAGCSVEEARPVLEEFIAAAMLEGWVTATPEVSPAP